MKERAATAKQVEARKEEAAKKEEAKKSKETPKDTMARWWKDGG
jgi:hypothetical protein